MDKSDETQGKKNKNVEQHEVLGVNGKNTSYEAQNSINKIADRRTRVTKKTKLSSCSTSNSSKGKENEDLRVSECEEPQKRTRKRKMNIGFDDSLPSHGASKKIKMSSQTNQKVRTQRKKKSESLPSSRPAKFVCERATSDENNWICSMCNILFGSPGDKKLHEDWVFCNKCQKKFHESCGEDFGILDEDETVFTCRDCEV